jgi:hypothetical protein
MNTKQKKTKRALKVKSSVKAGSKAVAKEPKHYIVHVAYAQLLE